MCFLGIAQTQCGYKCFDPSTKKLFVTMDIKFFEQKPFFGSHLQGEIKKEDSKFTKINNLDFLGFDSNSVIPNSRQQIYESPQI